MADKKKNVVEDRLVEGEKIVAQAVIHNGIYWQSVAVAILALLMSAAGGPFFSSLGVYFLAVAAGMAVYAAARKAIFLLVLTDKRILVRYGLLQVDVVDLHFDKLESFELERMPTGMIMGYARVAIQGTGTRYISIPYVANGPEIRKAYNEMVLNGKK